MIVVALALCAAAEGALAQGYPSKPIRWIVPFQPGGATDLIARLVGQKLGEALGQPVLIDNRPGANAIIGTELGAKAAPDGHTLVFAYNGNMTMNPALFRKLPYDALRDFAPISMICGAPFVLVAHPSVRAGSVQELVALASAQPGRLNLAVGGGAGQLSGELFKSMAGVNLTSVPYKGNAPSLAAVLGGQADLMFETVNAVIPHLGAGRLRALGVTSAKRWPSLPEIPAVAEALPGYDVLLWFGVAAPAGTAEEIVGRLSREITRIVQSAEVSERLSGQGFAVIASTPQQFSATISAELAQWARVVNKAGIPVE